ncbi:hypothetical protein [Mycobacterium intracellulare]|nr:hypothetical protein [Mycobacterium intracellulare]
MAKRTMGVSRLFYHVRRKPTELGNVADLPDGTDLLDVFEAFTENELTPDTLVSKATESYVRLTRTIRIGRAMVLEFESGRFGEEGTIRDITTHEEVAKYKRSNATAVITHGVLLVPKSGTGALVFTERSAGQGGMSGLADHFVDVVNARFGDYLMKRQSVVRSQAWLKAAQLTKVEGTVRKYRTDTASDVVDDVVGDLRHTFMPTRGEKYLPRRVFEALRDRKINRARFLGFPADTELDEVEVTLTDGHQSKTFEVGNEKTPNLNLVLTSSGSAAPSSRKVLDTALDEAAEIFAYYGIEWGEGDAIKSAAAKRK